MSKIWFITGASRGLGRALSETVLKAGHRLVATARDPRTLDDLVAGHGDTAFVTQLDVTDPHAADEALVRAQGAFGGVDVLVNNAGYGDIGSAEDTALADIRSQIETNLFGAIHVTRAAIPLMRRQGSGHMLMLSSVGGRVGAPGRTAYSAAKWGLEGYAEALALEMALIGVKVTIVEPGGLRTDFAGSSTTLNPGRPEYDAVVGAQARRQAQYNGNQPGDPFRAAQALLKLVELNDPPLRLPLGSDAVRIIRAADEGRLAELECWRDLSASADFASSST